MSRRQPKLLIEDIIESGEKIFTYTAGLSFGNLKLIVKLSMP